MTDDLENKIRLAVFEWLKIQVNLYGEVLDWQLLSHGFFYDGQRVPLIGAQGIWKPAVMNKYPLSITTVPESIYPDIISEENFIQYHYRGDDPDHRDNVGLRAAMKEKIPLIYFHRVVKGKYFVHWPVYIIGEDRANKMFVAHADAEIETLLEHVQDPGTVEGRREYITTLVKVRLHQQSFRERVLLAYREHCTVCGLRHRELLDAAHIIPDNEGGKPVVQNGLSLCKLHHAAFDNHFIGIDPDYHIEVSDKILQETDGPVLKYGLQKLHHQKILLPGLANRPNQEWLQVRYQRFRKAI